MKITDEIIEKIVQNAYYMTQRKNVGISRKNLYREYIKKFIKCGISLCLELKPFCFTKSVGVFQSKLVINPI